MKIKKKEIHNNQCFTQKGYSFSL